MTTVVQHRPAEPREEWIRPFPADWMALLRELSPVAERTSYLWPRWRRDVDAEGEGQWLLYEAVPARILDPGRITQLSVHWSDLPKAEQAGRKRFVSEYQFYMFQTHRVDVRPFWALQGTQFITGGTPVSFSPREKRIMEAQQINAEPIPPGTLPNIPFDQRVVRAIQARDRLRKVGMNLDALERQHRPEALQAEDDAIEQEHRKAFLQWLQAENAPCAEFMTWYTRQKESTWTLPPAPKNLANQVTDFRDRFIEHGIVEGAQVNSRRRQIAVA